MFRTQYVLPLEHCRHLDGRIKNSKLLVYIYVAICFDTQIIGSDIANY